MTLIAIKQYFMQVKLASLSGVAQYFNADPEVLRAMMCHWIRKGCLRQLPKNVMCGKQCVKCDPLVTDVYEWIAT